MFTTFLNACRKFLNHVRTQLKKITRPTTATLAVGALSDLPRSKSDLIVENAILRQQLIVLKRSVKRPSLTQGDRTRLVFLSRLTDFWQSALHIVQPDTLIRWHRELFRWYWRRKSKPKGREPRIPLATIKLIKQMARENRTWGAKKIRGELLKLGIDLDKDTIKKYMRQVRRRSHQNWAIFLRNHAHEVWACDFTVVHDLLFRPLYIFVIIAHQNRQIIHIAVTRHPTDAWVAQQLREATPWGRRPRFIIRDNDKKYGDCFAKVARGSGIKVLKTPILAPRANAICERFIGSLRREALDFFIILHHGHLHRVVTEYADYYNHERAHQGIEQRIPTRFNEPRPPLSKEVKGKVIARPILRGLHHSYAYASV